MDTNKELLVHIYLLTYLWHRIESKSRVNQQKNLIELDLSQGWDKIQIVREDRIADLYDQIIWSDRKQYNGSWSSLTSDYHWLEFNGRWCSMFMTGWKHRIQKINWLVFETWVEINFDFLQWKMDWILPTFIALLLIDQKAECTV